MGTSNRAFFERPIFNFIHITESCWLWTGYITSDGYGEICLPENDGKRKKVPAHRYVYEECVSLIPVGLHLHHVCRVRNCVNPEHLQLVSPSEHPLIGDTASRRSREKTHCNYGHEFTPQNTRVRVSRECRECRKRWISLRNKRLGPSLAETKVSK